MVSYYCKVKKENLRRYTMYIVYAYDDMVCDAVVVFEGSLEECREYVADDEFDEFEIVAPDGFTSVE